MVELRKDPISSGWVIVNKNRDLNCFSKSEIHLSDEKYCPFCVGKEKLTPPQIIAYDKSKKITNDKDWNIRVIPNNKPILAIEGSLLKKAEGIFDKMNGIGAHEIIIETPLHNKDTHSFTVEEYSQILQVVQERIRDLKNDSRFEYILVFKNYGLNAGETISHSHLQLVAMPVIPKTVKEEIYSGLKYFEYKERCLFCDIISQEISSGTRVVTENDFFIAFVPFASRYPFEVWILPKEHSSDFRTINDSKVITDFASISTSVFRRLYKVLDNPAYNLFLHSLPLKENFLQHYHWHVEIIPQIVKTTGFELGTGLYVNPILPEESAKFLREAE